MSRPLQNPPDESRTVVFDLGQRLSPPVLTLAWEHLWNSQENPTFPLHPDLSQLTDLEWHLCRMTLQENLALRERCQLQ